jgi:hypothetical protein
MDPEEAIYSLEAVGHDFYIYKDKASGQLRVSGGGGAACGARPCVAVY